MTIMQSKDRNTIKFCSNWFGIPCFTAGFGTKQKSSDHHTLRNFYMKPSFGGLMILFWCLSRPVRLSKFSVISQVSCILSKLTSLYEHPGNQSIQQEVYFAYQWTWFLVPNPNHLSCSDFVTEDYHAFIVTVPQMFHNQLEELRGQISQDTADTKLTSIFYTRARA